MFNLTNEQKILSVVVGLLQTVRDGYVINEDLSNEITNLAHTLNCIEYYTDNSTKIDTSGNNNANLARKLINLIGTDIVI